MISSLWGPLVGPKGNAFVPGEAEVGYEEKVLPPEGGCALEQAPQSSSGHGTKHERVQEDFEQCSEGQVVALGKSPVQG